MDALKIATCSTKTIKYRIVKGKLIKPQYAQEDNVLSHHTSKEFKEHQD